MGWGDFPDQVLSSWLTTVQGELCHLLVSLPPLFSRRHIATRSPENSLKQFGQCVSRLVVVAGHNSLLARCCDQVRHKMLAL